MPHLISPTHRAGRQRSGKGLIINASVLSIMILSFTFFSQPAVCEERNQRSPGIIWGNSVGAMIPLWQKYYQAEDFFEYYFLGAAFIGYHFRGFDLTADGMLSEHILSLGLTGMKKIDPKGYLYAGGGISFISYRSMPALEIVLPRLDLRIPFMRSHAWTFVWTIARLSYIDQTLFKSSDEWEEPRERALYLMSYIGLMHRLNSAWERECPPPMSKGLLIRTEQKIGLMSPTADERYDLAWVEDPTGDFPSEFFLAVDLSIGYRFEQKKSFIEVELPFSVYATSLNAGVGLSFLWRHKRAPWLALGATALYYPKEYILVEAPRIILTWRPTEIFEIFLKPLGFLVLIEPDREVWIEEGLESKIPYWGLSFGLGMSWTVPNRK